MSDEKENKQGDNSGSKQPSGGFDDTPLPSNTGGYTVKFTFHRATNLPISDLDTLNSDPFLYCVLTTDLPQRHKADGPLVLRTPTCRRTTEPTWDVEWTVANLPASGFKLKVRVLDEDPGNADDRLGNVHIYYNRLDEHFEAVKNQPFDILKRSGSWRAYGLQACVSGFSKKRMRGSLFVSMEVLGQTPGKGGKVYVVGPSAWSEHFSPLIGKIAGTKQTDKDGMEKSTFQANQLQLDGRVPDELYHRYVEFKPFVKGMFDSLGLQGKALHKLLRHQHNRVYLYDKTTKYGVCKERSEELALQFLRMAHFDQGARMFTYVLLLNGLFRFTETGKEFGIDLLSKHTMHSQVASYVACAGEFLIRRAKSSGEAERARSANGQPSDSPPEDVSLYELIIDNDSGTYRPNGKVMPYLERFLSDNFVGLKVTAKLCDDDAHQKMKEKQRERKKKEGHSAFYMQGNLSSGSLSSSDASSFASREAAANESAAQSAKKMFKGGAQAVKNPRATAVKVAEKKT